MSLAGWFLYSSKKDILHQRYRHIDSLGIERLEGYCCK